MNNFDWRLPVSTLIAITMSYLKETIILTVQHKHTHSMTTLWAAAASRASIFFLYTTFVASSRLSACTRCTHVPHPLRALERSLERWWELARWYKLEREKIIRPQKAFRIWTIRTLVTEYFLNEGDLALNRASFERP